MTHRALTRDLSCMPILFTQNYQNQPNAQQFTCLGNPIPFNVMTNRASCANPNTNTQHKHSLKSLHWNIFSRLITWAFLKYIQNIWQWKAKSKYSVSKMNYLGCSKNPHDEQRILEINYKQETCLLHILLH